ncbi:hypothetical protein GOODEAATRI_014019 [Goodea atripinnis]|uniref:Uncharacterized protein n=1 Tax=Goodea atripinnis TaxID=208336 RepID=A0ABV0MHM4_9TELE
MPCCGPCEVLSAWPLWSAMATGCLLHSTSNPCSRPQKRKFGLLKWRGCSLAIYRALYRSSTTHDIPYENQCACGACGVCEYWGLKLGEWGRSEVILGRPAAEANYSAGEGVKNRVGCVACNFPVSLSKDEGGLATDPGGDGMKSGTSQNTSPGFGAFFAFPPPISPWLYV